jgi:hypothetical protein
VLEWEVEKSLTSSPNNIERLLICSSPTWRWRRPQIARATSEHGIARHKLSYKDYHTRAAIPLPPNLGN